MKALMRLLYIVPTAVVIMFLLPVDSIPPVSRVLAPAIALMAAGIFPSMSLVITTMANLSGSQKIIYELHETLKDTLRALRFAFTVSVATILGVAALVALDAADSFPYQNFTLRAVIFMVALGIMLLGERFFAGLNIFFALLNLARSKAVENAERQSKALFDKVKAEPGLPPDDYGEKKTRSLVRKDSAQPG